MCDFEDLAPIDEKQKQWHATVTRHAARFRFSGDLDSEIVSELYKYMSSMFLRVWCFV